MHPGWIGNGNELRVLLFEEPQKEQREIIKDKKGAHYGNKDCGVYDEMSGFLERDDIDAVINHYPGSLACHGFYRCRTRGMRSRPSSRMFMMWWS